MLFKRIVIPSFVRNVELATSKEPEKELLFS
jgi:hypothetical protein